MLNAIKLFLIFAGMVVIGIIFSEKAPFAVWGWIGIGALTMTCLAWTAVVIFLTTALRQGDL